MTNALDAFIGRLTYHLWDKKEGGHRLAEYRRLQKQQYYSRAELQTLQTEKLTRLLSHAFNTSSWYRDIMKSIDILPGKGISLRDLQKFPVTRKADIRENLDRFISTEYDRTTLNRAKTGGSTGVSLDLYFDERCQQLRNAAQRYADNLAGWTPGTRVAAVWGNPPVARTTKQKLRSALLERTIYLDTMQLDADSLHAFVKQWHQYKPEVLFGHAHSIYLFAQYLRQHEIHSLRPSGIVATSMMLLDHERDTIESAFQCKVTNRYGCEEVGLIAVECEYHKGMHINSPHVIVECLDEQDRPVEPGHAGKLVITDLNNYAMPLIRYRVEDVGVLSERECECGRHLPLLEKLEGRVADFLKKADGGQVAGVSLVERTLTHIPGIQQMQLIQESLDALIVNRVRANDYTDATDTTLTQELQRVFGPSVTIDIRDVVTIPQEASGKYRFSICRI